MPSPSTITASTKPAQFKQAVPLAPVACQGRGFQAEHSSDFPTADFRHQMVESRTLDQAATRAAQVIVNGLHLGKPQLPCSLQAVLQALALSVVENLAGRSGRKPQPATVDDQRLVWDSSSPPLSSLSF